MDADVGQREDRPPFPPLLPGLDREMERVRPGGILLRRAERGNAVGVELQERRVVVVVGNAQVVLHHVAGLKFPNGIAAE